MTSFELMVAKIGRMLATISLVTTTFVTSLAQEITPAAQDSSNSNPLRGSDAESAAIVPNSNELEKKNKQLVRGTKANEKPTAPATIDFVIIGHEDESIKPETDTMVLEGNKSPESSPNRMTVLEVASSINQDELIAVEAVDLQSEYERLHTGESKSDVPTDFFVMGEDTDNPDFDSRSSAKSEAPAEMAEVLDTEAVMQLSENNIEFPAEDYPEDSSQKPADEKSIVLGTKATEDNEDADEGEAILVDDPKPNPLPVDVVSRPTLRRPKPINIEPLESQAPESPVKVEVKSPVASTKPPAAPTTSLPIAKVEPLKVVDAAAQYRLKRIDATLSYYLTNPESATVRSPWAVMHAILPFGADAELVYKNQRVNAIAWMCANRVCKTQTIFNHRVNAISPNVGGGVQGHDGQFLAILAQSGVSSQYPVTINQKRYTVADLVQFEMANCKPKTELTFRLIGLSYYLGTKQSWRSRDRQVWNVERLLAEELAQPINGAACGGTHRLMGIYRAIEQRKDENMPLTGKFATAEKYIADYKDYAWTLQNPDGSFSTNWFESRAYENDDERKVQTTGHILEWLVYSSTATELKSHRTDAAIDFLMTKIYDKRDYKWPIGPRGHALRAIALYREKAYGLEPMTLSNVAGSKQIEINR